MVCERATRWISNNAEHSNRSFLMRLMIKGLTISPVEVYRSWQEMAGLLIDKTALKKAAANYKFFCIYKLSNN
jgi:hypothetical protein